MQKGYLVFIMILPFMTFGQGLTRIHTITIQSLKEFKMYPNLVYGDEVYITSTTSGNQHINVYDIFGELVLSNIISTPTLNSANLIPGIYIIQITKDKKTITRKLVVR